MNSTTTAPQGQIETDAAVLAANGRCKGTENPEGWEKIYAGAIERGAA